MSCRGGYFFLLNISHLFKSNKIYNVNMSFYAVARGRTTGIFTSWPDCEAQVKGFSGARYKKFNSEAGAQEFINSVSGTAPAANNKQNNAYSSSFSGNSNNNLKRPYSTTLVNQATKKTNSNKTKFKKNETKYESTSDRDESGNWSDESDDLNTILVKQMDDIEKRLSGFEKGVDKIIKKNTKNSRRSILIEPPKPKQMSRINTEFEEDSDGYVKVYTDGACSANGRICAKAGLGVYWGDGHHLNTSEPVSGRATNNCGEIQAATRAIRLALDNGVKKLSINTDSQFLINSVTKWMPGWKRKGWKLQSGEPVKNEKDFKDLDSLQHQLQIKWNYVEAHRGVHGNEMADQLAKAGAAMYHKS